MRRYLENPYIAGPLLFFALFLASTRYVPRAEVEARIEAARIEGAREAFSMVQQEAEQPHPEQCFGGWLAQPRKRTS